MKLKKVIAKNYKSFFDEEFNFDVKTNANYIYGANGIGKSTFIDMFTTLSDIFLRELNLYNISKLPPHVKMNNLNSYRNEIYRNIVTWGTSDEVFLSFVFECGNEKIQYSIGIIEGDVITRERFVILDKNWKEKKVIFNKVLNKEFETSDDFYEITEFVEGEITKNTLSSIVSLSMLKFSISRSEGKNISIESDNIFTKLYSSVLVPTTPAMAEIDQITSSGMVVLAKDINDMPADGVTRANVKYDIIDKFFKSFEVFVTSIDKSIRGVKLLVIGEDAYTLSLSYSFTKDFGGGRKLDIPIGLESLGTRRYLEIFNKLNNIQDENSKNIVFIDEIGSKLHEELLINIANYINKNAYKYDKQVIITTHNSILLDDSYIERPVPSNSNKEKYFMNRTFDGKVILENIKNENIRNNNQKKFLLGHYGAGPKIEGIYTEKDE